MANVRITKVELETLSQYTAEIKVRVTKIQVETLSGAPALFPGRPPERVKAIWVGLR